MLFFTGLLQIIHFFPLKSCLAGFLAFNYWTFFIDFFFLCLMEYKQEWNIKKTSVCAVFGFFVKCYSDWFTLGIYGDNPVILVLILFLGRWKNWKVCLNALIKCCVLNCSADKSSDKRIHKSSTGTVVNLLFFFWSLSIASESLV